MVKFHLVGNLHTQYVASVGDRPPRFGGRPTFKVLPWVGNSGTTLLIKLTEGNQGSSSGDDWSSLASDQKMRGSETLIQLCYPNNVFLSISYW